MSARGAITNSAALPAAWNCGVRHRSSEDASLKRVMLPDHDCPVKRPAPTPNASTGEVCRPILLGADLNFASQQPRSFPGSTAPGDSRAAARRAVLQAGCTFARCDAPLRLWSHAAQLGLQRPKGKPGPGPGAAIGDRRFRGVLLCLLEGGRIAVTEAACGPFELPARARSARTREPRQSDDERVTGASATGLFRTNNSP